MEDEERHMTPADLARHWRERGVGRDEKPVNGVYHATEGRLTIGMLDLILTELKDARRSAKAAEHDSVDERIRSHQRYMRCWHACVGKLYRSIDRETKRVVSLCGELVRSSRDISHCEFSHHVMSRRFHRDEDCFCGEYWSDQFRLRRLKSVKKPGDAINLIGIGKKTAAKIVAAASKKGTSG